MVTVRLSAEILQLGLVTVGFDVRPQRSTATNMKRFRSFFGAGPKSCVEILNDLQTTENVYKNVNTQFVA